LPSRRGEIHAENRHTSREPGNQPPQGRTGRDDDEFIERRKKAPPVASLERVTLPCLALMRGSSHRHVREMRAGADIEELGARRS
jgi:hypothetical protein